VFSAETTREDKLSVSEILDFSSVDISLLLEFSSEGADNDLLTTATSDELFDSACDFEVSGEEVDIDEVVNAGTKEESTVESDSGASEEEAEVSVTTA
jgi:hypothetical protein